MDRAKRTDVGIYRRLLSLARPYWKWILGVQLVGLLSTPLSLLTPLPLKIVVDNVIGSEPVPSWLLIPSIAASPAGILAFAVALLLLVALLSQLQGAASSNMYAYGTQKLLLNFRARLFRHVQRLSLSYHDSRGITDSLYRIQYDAPSVASVAFGGIWPMVIALVTLVSMFYVVLQISWQLALVALAIAPVLFIITWIFRPALRHQSRDVKKLESSAFSVVNEVLSAIRVVKAFGQEDRERERFVTRSQGSLRARIKLNFVQSRFNVFMGLTTAAGTGIVIWLGVQLIQSGTITLGDLLLVMGYLGQIYGPLSTIGKTVAGLQSQLVSAERVLTILDQPPEVVEQPNARSITNARGAITFRNVAFAYDRGRPILQDISFYINPGTRVGITGVTGAGKTSLTNLLTRFYDPTEGEILLDGIDLREYRLEDLRRQFAIVLQDPVLFSTTIAENISYARPNASHDDIVAAAKAANIHDFIIGQPDGYETLVGERGMRLSGGERQRISLARAFLKDAPILILDEPTSSVDLHTEAAIMQAIDRLTHGRTTFLITHRLTTLRNCDLLIGLDHSRLTEFAPISNGRGD
jgi:ATP-binding cassette subfamily B protein